MNAARTWKDRCQHWRLRTRTLEFGELPALMGVVNVTPDSFSDGGSFLLAQAAIEHALRLEDAGADIVDIGAESTRPYSAPVAADEELRRIVPVLDGLKDRLACPISIDTSKSKVAQAAVELGAEIINDVTGLSADPRMMHIAAVHQVAVCAMHMQGTPQTMQDAPQYENVVEQIWQYLVDREQSLVAGGIESQRICLDPGIGFGKTHAHNLSLIESAQRFLQTGRPVLVGHSRKGFIGNLIGDKQRDRAAGSVGISLALARQGIQIIRVHDVAATRDALLCFAAAGGLRK